MEGALSGGRPECSPGAAALRAVLLAGALLGASVPATAEPGPQTRLALESSFDGPLPSWLQAERHQRVAEAGACRSGACLHAAVRRADTAAIVRLRAPLAAGRLYRLRLWARADRQSALTIWLGAQGANLVQAHWPRVPARWTEYQVLVTGSDATSTTIGIVAPSSHRAPPGGMWLDDLRLEELPLPQRVHLAGTPGAPASDDADEPDLIASGSELWAAWAWTRAEPAGGQPDSAGPREAASLTGRPAADGTAVAADAPHPARLATGLGVALLSPSGHDQRAGHNLALAERWLLPASERVLEPRLAPDGRGGAWLVYSATADGDWELFARHLSRAGPGQPLRLTARPGADRRPVAAWANGRLWIAWEASGASRHEVWAAQLRALPDSEPGQRAAPALPPTALPVRHPERGARPEAETSQAPGLADVQRLSEPTQDSHEPALAAWGAGVAVAWHAFRPLPPCGIEAHAGAAAPRACDLQRAQAEVYGRLLSSGGAGPLERLSDDGAQDRHAQLASDPAGPTLWLAWERSEYAGDEVGRVTRRCGRLARWQPAAAPPRPPEPPAQDAAARVVPGLTHALEPDELACERWPHLARPMLAPTSDGDLLLSGRVPRERTLGWDALLWHLPAAGGQMAGQAAPAAGPAHEPRHLAAGKGMSRRIPFTLVAGQLVAAVQEDDVRGFLDDPPPLWGAGQSRITLALVPLGDAPLAPASRQEMPPPARAPGHGHVGAAPTPGLATTSPTATVGAQAWTRVWEGQTLQLLLGDLHAHSELSPCLRVADEDADESYAVQRSVRGLDFGVLTDHDYALTPDRWHRQQSLAGANAGARFTTLLGQEWTSSFEVPTPGHPHGRWGHRVLLLSDRQHPRWYDSRDGSAPSQLMAALRRDGADYVLIPHQLADRGNVPVDLSAHDPAAEPVAEIFQMRGSYECRDCPRRARRSLDTGPWLQNLWAAGRLLGVIAAPDHGGGQGLAGVWSASRDPAALLAALRARHSYGTSGAPIRLDVTLSGAARELSADRALMMGDVGPAPDGRPVNLELAYASEVPMRSVELLRANRVIAAQQPETSAGRLVCVERPAAGVATWYYVRLTRADGQLAWSSPIWLGRPGASSASQAPAPQDGPARPAQ